jgi:hypothetical protein
MKRLLLLFISMTLLLLVSQPALAQETSTSTAILNVQYDLPYAGILPDNPLYFLKALRDNVLGMFITDPAQKANYDLLMADKRLGAAQALLAKGKVDLAITTLSKSGNYFYLAVQQATVAKQQGQDTASLLSTLDRASLKHQQVIFAMEARSKQDVSQVLAASQERIAGFQKSVEQLMPKQ